MKPSIITTLIVVMATTLASAQNIERITDLESAYHLEIIPFEIPAGEKLSPRHIAIADGNLYIANSFFTRIDKENEATVFSYSSSIYMLPSGGIDFEKIFSCDNNISEFKAIGDKIYAGNKTQGYEKKKPDNIYAVDGEKVTHVDNKQAMLPTTLFRGNFVALKSTRINTASRKSTWIQTMHMLNDKLVPTGSKELPTVKKTTQIDGNLNMPQQIIVSGDHIISKAYTSPEVTIYKLSDDWQELRPRHLLIISSDIERDKRQQAEFRNGDMGRAIVPLGQTHIFHDTLYAHRYNGGEIHDELFLINLKDLKADTRCLEVNYDTINGDKHNLSRMVNLTADKDGVIYLLLSDLKFSSDKKTPPKPATTYSILKLTPR